MTVRQLMELLRPVPGDVEVLLHDAADDSYGPVAEVDRHSAVVPRAFKEGVWLATKHWGGHPSAVLLRRK